jgi:hypothetical protein
VVWYASRQSPDDELPSTSWSMPKHKGMGVWRQVHEAGVLSELLGCKDVRLLQSVPLSPLCFGLLDRQCELARKGTTGVYAC